MNHLVRPLVLLGLAAAGACSDSTVTAPGPDFSIGSTS